MGGTLMLRLSSKHIGRQAQALLQRVLDVLGEDAVDRIGLMAREPWQAMGLAVGAREFKDRLDHAQQARVDGDAIMGDAFTVATDDTAAHR